MIRQLEHTPTQVVGFPWDKPRIECHARPDVCWRCVSCFRCQFRQRCKRFRCSLVGVDSIRGLLHAVHALVIRSAMSEQRLQQASWMSGHQISRVAVPVCFLDQSLLWPRGGVTPAGVIWQIHRQAHSLCSKTLLHSSCMQNPSGLPRPCNAPLRPLPSSCFTKTSTMGYPILLSDVPANMSMKWDRVNLICAMTLNSLLLQRVKTITKTSHNIESHCVEALLFSQCTPSKYSPSESMHRCQHRGHALKMQSSYLCDGILPISWSTASSKRSRLLKRSPRSGNLRVG